MSRSLLLAVVLSLVVGACGDDVATDSGTVDADTSVDATVDTGTIAVDIDAPALPALTPCPAGWREIAPDPGAPAYCEPYPETGLDDCATDEAHFPGTPGCAPIGDPCPVDGWPTDLPASDVLYVRADAATGGDGTRVAPFIALQEAFDVAPDGGTVAVAPGTYGSLQIDRPVSVVGACTEVILTSTGIAGTIVVEDADVSLRNIRISGAREGIWADGGSMTLDGVVIDDIAGTGIRGVRVTVSATRLRFDAMRDSAMAFTRGSIATIDQLAVRDVANDPLRTATADALIRDAYFERAEHGVFYFGSQSGGVLFERTAFLGAGTILGLNAPRIEMRDSVFVGPPASVVTEPGAIATFEGGDVVLERVRIERARSLGVAVADATGTLTVRDAIFRDILGVGDGIGHAIELGSGAEGTVERVFIERAAAIGILAALRQTRLTVEDVVILDTQPNVFGTFGRALQVQTGAWLSGSRVVVRGSHEAAVVAGGSEALVDLSHLVVEGTEPRTCDDCPSAGIGVGAYLGGAVSLTRFRISNNALAGVQLADEGSVDLSDGEVSSNPVGVNVQVPDYEVERLTRGVAFRDNGANLDSSELPVPAATARP